MSGHLPLLGRDFEDGAPIVAPKTGHAAVLAAVGGGKTTTSVMVRLFSLLDDHDCGAVVTDSKNGEIAAQAVQVCLNAGRKVAVIDPGNTLKNIPCRQDLNPYGGVMASYGRDNGELLFALDNANHALIAEPGGEGGPAKDYYWRASPRVLLETVKRSLLRRNHGFVTPAMVWTVISSPDTLFDLLSIDAEEADDDPALQAKCQQLLAMREHNSEHWFQHIGAAIDSLRIFEEGSFLHLTGQNAELTHYELLKENYIVFLVGDQRYINRMGPLYALNLQGFLDAQMTGEVGRTEFILDEFTNAPLAALIDSMTVLRAFSGFLTLIAQSRSEIVRKYGQQQMLTIFENATVKEWLGFSSFEEAKLVSDAMGQRNTYTRSINTSTTDDNVSGSFSLGKEPLMSPEELMALPSTEKIIHIKDLGFIRCLKLRQNEIAPYAWDLADNPLEGGKIPPDIKVSLPARHYKRGAA